MMIIKIIIIKSHQKNIMKIMWLFQIQIILERKSINNVRMSLIIKCYKKKGLHHKNKIKTNLL